MLKKDELEKENQDLIVSNKANMSLIKSAGDRNIELMATLENYKEAIQSFVEKIKNIDAKKRS